MSRTHLVKNAAMSRLKMAVCENAWMSPIQPIRSSRWGQSVGTPSILPRCTHSTQCMILFNRSLEHSNRPASAAAEWNTRPTTASLAGRPGKPVTST